MADDGERQAAARAIRQSMAYVHEKLEALAGQLADNMDTASAYGWVDTRDNVGHALRHVNEALKATRLER